MKIYASIASILLASLAFSSNSFAQDGMAPEETFTMGSESQGGIAPGSIGVGAASTLSGIGGPMVTYQGGPFHVDGIIGFQDFGNSQFSLAGRFWYQIHQSTGADFSIGGGLGFTNGNDDTDMHVELGAKIRMFIVPNVSVSTAVGFALVADEGENPYLLDGDVVGTAALTYFF